VRELRAADAILAREDAAGTRWYRCLRCDSWLALARAQHATRELIPECDQIDLPLRGKPLRDKLVLRQIALDRAFHFVVLAALGVLCTTSRTPSRPPPRICTCSAACCWRMRRSRASRLSGCGSSAAGPST
jgi:hypothetical protein